jgi:GNAT superfamily N-acetyltransferase
MAKVEPCPLIELLVRQALERTFPLYRPTQEVSCFSGSGGIFITYRLVKAMQDAGRMCLQITGPICYLLWITLPQRMRGQGHGAKLYAAAEEIAQACGCMRIVQTPSGWTYDKKEPRRTYVCRKLGYSMLTTGEAEKALV